MSPKRPPPGPAEATDAACRFLTGLARGADLDDLALAGYGAHPKNNTFPGEVYLHLAADALRLAGADADQPIAQDGLLARHLPEAAFKGRENSRIRFALLAAAATAGGLEVDLLDEVAWWAADDYWHYALCAAVALIRAGAERLDIPVAALAKTIAAERGINLDSDAGERTDASPPSNIRPLQ